MDTNQINANSATLSDEKQDGADKYGQLLDRVQNLERRMDAQNRTIDERFAMLSVQLESICDHLLKFESLIPDSTALHAPQAAVANDPCFDTAQPTYLNEQFVDHQDTQPLADVAGQDDAPDSIEVHQLQQNVTEPECYWQEPSENQVATETSEDHQFEEPADVRPSVETEPQSEESVAEEEVDSTRELMRELADDVDAQQDTQPLADVAGQDDAPDSIEIHQLQQNVTEPECYWQEPSDNQVATETSEDHQFEEPADVRPSVETEPQSEESVAADETVSARVLMRELADDSDDQLDELLDSLTSTSEKKIHSTPQTSDNEPTDLNDAPADESQIESTSDDVNSALNELFATITNKNNDVEQAQAESEVAQPDDLHAEVADVFSVDLNQEANDLSNRNVENDETPQSELDQLEEQISDSDSLLGKQEDFQLQREMQSDLRLDSALNSVLDEPSFQQSEFESEPVNEQDFGEPELPVEPADKAQLALNEQFVDQQQDTQPLTDVTDQDIAPDSIQSPELQSVTEPECHWQEPSDDYGATETSNDDQFEEPADIAPWPETEPRSEETMAEEEIDSTRELMRQSTDDSADQLDEPLDSLTSTSEKKIHSIPQTSDNEPADLNDAPAEETQIESTSDDVNSALNELFATLTKKDSDAEQAQVETDVAQPVDLHTEVAEVFSVDLNQDADENLSNRNADNDETPHSELDQLEERIADSESFLGELQDDFQLPADSQSNLPLDSTLNTMFDEPSFQQPESESESEPAFESDLEPDNDQDRGDPELQVEPAQPSTDGHSVAEVLARMQASGALELNFETVDESGEGSETTDEVGEEPPTIQSPPETKLECDGDGDVNNYMSQLLQRLGNGRQSDRPAPSIEKPEPAAEKPAPNKVAETTPNPEPPKNLLSAEEFKPKRQAPERNSDLRAMRDIANQSTREAVESSKFRRSKAKTTLLMGGVSIGIAGSAFLYSLCHNFGDIFFLGAIASLLASGTCAYFLFDEKVGKKEK